MLGDRFRYVHVPSIIRRKMALEYIITEEDKPEVDKVLAIMDRLVSEVGPDYKYEKFIKPDVGEYAACWYLDNDENCSCIIGHVLKELDWSVEDIEKLEGSTPVTGVYD